jgi:hypothetical protein
MGSWPRRMPAELAAGYCGETTVEALIKRVGNEYPQPRIIEGRRRLWLRDDLDLAICRTTFSGFGTSPRICDFHAASTPICSHQDAGEWSYWLLLGVDRLLS